MSIENDYLLHQEIILESEPLSGVWEQTLVWITNNNWKLLERSNEKSVLFNHVISSVRSYLVHKVEIKFDTVDKKNRIFFNVFINSEYLDKSISIKYKEVILEYLYFIKINLTSDMFNSLFSPSELQYLISSYLLNVVFINGLTLILLYVAFEKAFLLGYLLGVAFLWLSIPSIKKAFQYHELKKRVYTKDKLHLSDQ